MKKIICFILAACLSLIFFSSCTSMEEPETGTTAVTTAEPDPLAFLENRSQEYVDWWNSLNLPATVPEEGIAYEVLLKTHFFPFFSGTYGFNGAALITGTEDLDAFLALPQTTYTFEMALDLTPYEILREVDYTQNVVLMIGYQYHVSLSPALDRVWVHENNVIVRYARYTKYCWPGEAYESWCYALLIDRDDMPALGDDLQILYHIDQPNLVDPQQKKRYSGYPEVYGVDLVSLQKSDEAE